MPGVEVNCMSTCNTVAENAWKCTFLPVINNGIHFILELRNCGLHQLQAQLLQNCPIVYDIEYISKPRCDFMYKVYTIQKYTMYIRAYLCVSYYSHNKKKIFPYAALAVSSLGSIWIIFTALYGLTLYRSQCTLTTKYAVPWFMWLVADI